MEIVTRFTREKRLIMDFLVTKFSLFSSLISIPWTQIPQKQKLDATFPSFMKISSHKLQHNSTKSTIECFKCLIFPQFIKFSSNYTYSRKISCFALDEFTQLMKRRNKCNLDFSSQLQHHKMYMWNWLWWCCSYSKISIFLPNYKFYVKLKQYSEFNANWFHVVKWKLWDIIFQFWGEQGWMCNHNLCIEFKSVWISYTILNSPFMKSYSKLWFLYWNLNLIFDSYIYIAVMWN